MGEGLYIGFLIVMSLLLIAAIAFRSFAGVASVLVIILFFWHFELFDDGGSC